LWSRGDESSFFLPSLGKEKTTCRTSPWLLILFSSSTILFSVRIPVSIFSPPTFPRNAIPAMRHQSSPYSERGYFLYPVFCTGREKVDPVMYVISLDLPTIRFLTGLSSSTFSGLSSSEDALFLPSLLPFSHKQTLKKESQKPTLAFEKMSTHRYAAFVAFVFFFCNSAHLPVSYYLLSSEPFHLRPS